jgi:hypothetical protein
MSLDGSSPGARAAVSNSGCVSVLSVLQPWGNEPTSAIALVFRCCPAVRCAIGDSSMVRWMRYAATDCETNRGPGGQEAQGKGGQARSVDGDLVVEGFHHTLRRPINPTTPQMYYRLSGY